MKCRHVTAWGNFSTLDTLFGVGRSDACAVGEFAIGVGGGGSVSADAKAGGVATDEGDGAAMGTDCGMGT